MGGGICLNINKLQNIKFDSFAIATGCSLGIDSFSTIEKYTAKDCPEGYKLTHLSFFNAGAYGSNNLDKARIAYEHDLKLVKEFGKEMGLPIIEIETNFAVLYNRILPHYGDSGYIRNMSIVLSMQKLFKRYMYASSYQVNDLKHGFGSHFYLVSQLLSTPSTNITISLPIQTRTDKTKMILDVPLSYKYLNVCWGYLNIDEGFADIEKVKEKYLNCCRCDKCLRTLLTIDIMGYKDKYANIFDVKEYERVKNRYIGKVMALKDKAQFPKEIYILMQQQHTQIPLKAREYAIGYRLGLHSLISKVKKILIH